MRSTEEMAFTVEKRINSKGGYGIVGTDCMHGNIVFQGKKS